MANVFKGLFGGAKPSATATPDSDFADFAAEAPGPSPAPVSPARQAPLAQNPASVTGAPPVPYTKWYRVWERTSPKDFMQEAFILPFIILLVLVHTWGRRKNRRKAKAWATAHAPVLKDEFASVGFGGKRPPTVDEVENSGLAKAMASDSLVAPEELLREKTAQEFISYASGRQNVAFLDVKLSFYKRYNPLTLLIENILGVVFESLKPPGERMAATLYAFDGREKDLVPVASEQEQRDLEGKSKSLHSSFDGFVWAVVHKDYMRSLREDRYDISLTFTKDNSKLPSWATVMSESAEITEFLLTPDLIKAIEKAGDDTFEYIVVTDQPEDKPQKLEEANPRKRLDLALRMPPSEATSAYDSTLPLFTHFLRLPDTLVASAHFRPEVTRKLRNVREEELRKLRKVDDESKAEERKAEADKKKKAERDAKLKGLSADEQRKFLDKEREKDQRKAQKKVTKRA